MLHALAVSRGAAACDAPGIVQGVYLRVLRHAKVFGSADSFDAWLACLVRCEVIDTARRRGRRSWLNERFQQWQESRSIDGDDAARSQLEDALAGLDASDLSLIQRHYLDGWSQENLAEEHQISVKAVESKLARLRKRVRRNFEKAATHSSI
ncbi:sigma-70 family RNA polymerase sigma factor [Luteolibacter yonseiensis]|uniref:Sigma-70 family RNA polymerase sigma factor n=2 Tax=Luteolibacter yonseiensis TaxID=1144680 RepID=A0A934V6C4_9BACT|nr:sigma-70 family RNA polymerase sigma factor [Luteolibacter yonseiensis]